ncbi:MAG: hypothetical protein ACRENP_15215 [Longimicrobiales bacterium]
MTSDYNDDRLRRLYARLQARRSSSDAAPATAVEEIQVLAEGTYAGADRAQKLEAVLSDPRTAAEFQFFLDLAQQQPHSRTWMKPWLAAAASVIMLVTATLVWRATQPVTNDPLRSAAADFLAAPAAGATVSATTPFVWKRIPTAESYQYELIDEQGNLVHEAVTRDTSLTLPATAPVGTDVAFRWWVTARLQAGTDSVSSPRAVTFRR